MSIVVSGTTIPTTGDYIKVGSTLVDKVVCNGVTVWEKQKDITMTPSNSGGLSVSGDGWSKDYYSHNQSLDSTIYRLTTKIDLTSYKKISVEIYAWCKVSVNNSGSITVSITAGSKSTSRELASVYKEDDGSNGHNENAETVTMNLDVSQVSGEKTVSINMKIKHYGNQYQEGNSWGKYKINKIRFLT